mgnify:CR=1 FL=1
MDQGNNDLKDIQPLLEFKIRKFPYVAYALGITFIISAAYFIGAGMLTEIIFGDEKMNFIAWINAAAQILFMLLPALLASIPVPLHYRELFRLNIRMDKIIVLYSFMALIAFQFFVSGYAVLQDLIIPEKVADEYDKLKDMIEEIYDTILGGESLYAFLRAMTAGAVVPAIAEETLFRGFLQRSLEERMRPASAIALSGVFFGVIHFNPIDMIPLVIIGLFLGFLAYAGRNILLPIIIHFANNAFAIIIFYSAEAQELESSAGELSPVFAAVLCFGGLLFVFLFCRLIYDRSRKSEY